MTDLTLATLLSSRICHDLISPVSAVNNGLEILEADDDPEMREQAMNLIRKSAATASAKLQFMRVSFGVAGAMAETVPLDEARTLAEGLTANSPVTLDWRAAEVTLDKEAVRLLLNFILIGFESLPRGGTLSVGARREGATNMMVSAQGPKARIQEKAADLLRNGAALEDVDPKGSSFYLTHQLAKSLNATMHLSVEDERIELGATI